MESNIEKALKNFKKELDKLKPAIPTIESSPTMPYVQINGEEYLVFCSNNYLGLANSDFVKKAAIEVINQFGFGSAGSRWASGTTCVHKELEGRLADFKQKEDAVTFSAGFMANSGTIPVLTSSLIGDKPFPGKEVSIFSDALNHASIIDGCRSSEAKVYIYDHKNMEHLAKLLSSSREKYKLIITDSVFSMDGDVAPLDKLATLASEYKAMVMVDEAHAVGIFGKYGRGAAEYFGVEDQVDIAMGTFSKTFGSLGGYVACSKELAEYIRCSSRNYIFSASMPACSAAVVIAIINAISSSNKYKKKLINNANYFRERLNELGFDTLDSQSAIIPILIGDEAKTIELANKLFRQKIYLTCAVWPAVEKKQARLRATVTSNHTKEQIDKLISALKHCYKNKIY